MNKANLEEKYEKLAAILKCAKNKHMPKQIVKYNKKKHKKSKWMTQAILNPINMKDVLYKKFIQANNEDENIYSALKRNILDIARLYATVLKRPRKCTTQELLIYTRMT